MTRRTRYISLVVLGSALSLIGCSRTEDEEKKDNEQGHTGTSTVHRHRSWMPLFIPFGGGGMSSRPGSSVGSVPHGGFGSTGHAIGGGS